MGLFVGHISKKRPKIRKMVILINFGKSSISHSFQKCALSDIIFLFNLVNLVHSFEARGAHF